VQWNTFDCIVNPSIVMSHTCLIVGPERSLITTELLYNVTFEQFHADFVLELPRPPAMDYHKIVSVDVDICRFYKDSRRNRFLSIAYKSMIKNSNLPKKCPQKKGFYFFRNMDIGDNLPAFLPKTDFKVHFNFFQPTDWVLNISLSGRVIE
ncbi:hypothetical protein KR222_006691, partial [Zaprionus bogoriensis]